MRGGGLVLVAWVASIGCVGSKSVPCGPLVCALNDVCAPSQDRCVQPQQLESCKGMANGAACSYPSVSAGACFEGICGPVGCGNNVIEPDLGEVCDDGNRVSLDGCSADCMSRETCGDGVVDLVRGEQCDCGSAGMAVPGCDQENSDSPGAACRLDCKPARCGDGVLDPVELCDDGNVDPGDGCRADCLGRWTVMQSGTYANLTAVWGSGPDDVYAVGRDVLLHFDGAHWTKMPLPFPDMQMSDVWGVGTDVYAIGVITSGAVGGHLIKRTGSTWSDIASFPGGAKTGSWSIYGVSPTDFWAVNTNSALYHFDGTSWATGWACHTSGGSLLTELTSVYADTAGHAYVTTGGSTYGGGVCRFDNDAWTFTAYPTVTANRVWGTSASDLYVTSFLSDDYDLVSHSTDGTTWSGEPEARAIIYGTGLGGSAGDVLVLGDQGRVVGFDGTSWAIRPTTVNVTLRDAWGYAPGKAFIVGDNGTILH